MDINIKCNGSSLIIKIIGDIDHHIAQTVKQKIEKSYNDNNATNIIFDFTQVSFMDSSGIGMIIGRYKNLVPGGEIKIYGVDENIKKIFDISGLNKIVKFCDTLENAVGGKHEL